MKYSVTRHLPETNHPRENWEMVVEATTPDEALRGVVGPQARPIPMSLTNGVTYHLVWGYNYFVRELG